MDRADGRLTYQNTINQLHHAIAQAKDEIEQLQILVGIISKAVDDYGKKRYSLLRKALEDSEGKWESIVELYGWGYITKRKYDQLCEQKEALERDRIKPLAETLLKRSQEDIQKLKDNIAKWESQIKKAEKEIKEAEE